MRFSIVSRGDETSEIIRDKMIYLLKENKLLEDDGEPELVITIGGDGTLLRAVQQYKNLLSHVSFVGVHTGNLGFYADWNVSEVDTLVNYIVFKPINKALYPLVEVISSFNNPKQKEQKYIALNEVMVRSAAPTVVFDVELNGIYFERFRGDGLCFSTPSGSTGYNKSLGGSVIHPSIPVMQITEMASINNRVYRTLGSSVVLPKEHDCLLKPVENTELQILLDSSNFCHIGIKSLQIKVSNEHVSFARYRPFPFWSRVQNKFI